MASGSLVEPELEKGTSGPKGRGDFGRYISGALKALLPPHKCGGSHLGPDTNPLNPPPWTMRTAANDPGPSGMDASSRRGPLAGTAPLIYFIEKHPTPSAAASAVFEAK